MTSSGKGRPPEVKSEPIEGFELIETGTVAIYRSLYGRIFWDLDHADRELRGESIDYANLIHAAAHLRLVIEQVTIASFVASHKFVAQAERSVRAADNFDKARKTLKKLNPNYWPVAFGEITRNGATALGVQPGMGLAEEEIGRYFGTVSEVLHAQSPYVQSRAKAGPDAHYVQYSELSEKLRSLVTSHIVQMAGAPEFLYLRRYGEDIRVQAVSTETPLLSSPKPE